MPRRRYEDQIKPDELVKQLGGGMRAALQLVKLATTHHKARETHEVTACILAIDLALREHLQDEERRLSVASDQVAQLLGRRGSSSAGMGMGAARSSSPASWSHAHSAGPSAMQVEPCRYCGSSTCRRVRMGGEDCRPLTMQVAPPARAQELEDDDEDDDGQRRQCWCSYVFQEGDDHCPKCGSER